MYEFSPTKFKLNSYFFLWAWSWQRHLGIHAPPKLKGSRLWLCSSKYWWKVWRRECFCGGGRSPKMEIHLLSLHNKILALIIKTHQVNIMWFSIGGIAINIFVNGSGWQRQRRQMMLNPLLVIPVVTRFQMNNEKFNLPFGLFHLWHKIRMWLFP